MTMNSEHSRQIEQEAIDWLYCAIGVAVIVGLILACVTGHHWISLGIAP